jgi:uncharacterized protein (TIGR03905 family)
MTYKTKNVCCNEIHIDVSNGIINEIKFTNGCNGNLQAIAALAKGRKTEEIIATLSGITCKSRNTSCPDQLATALREIT